MSTRHARRTWNRQLLDAARHGGNLAAVQQALQNGANVEVTGTRWMYSSSLGLPEMVTWTLFNIF